MSGGDGDAGGVTVDEAAKPMTAVQDCVLTFVSKKPLDTFKKTSGQFAAVVTRP